MPDHQGDEVAELDYVGKIATIRNLSATSLPGQEKGVNRYAG
jgi:hypothetical protein